MFQDFDECLEGPCLNGGICTQTAEPGGYTCACTDEYKGDTCEELKIKRCKDSPCQHGATCVDVQEDPNSEFKKKMHKEIGTHGQGKKVWCR